MCILLSIIKTVNDSFEKNKNKDDLEKEMNAYNLDEYEKNLVRKGLYDPWNFDTEGPFEDDDYYKDDDDYDNF